jgi:hypothetical protein
MRKNKKRLSTKEAIDLRNNKRLLLNKFETYKKDFEFAEQRRLSHNSLIHLYYSDMQILSDACKEYQKKCKLFPSETDICKIRLYEFNGICEQDLKRRDTALKEKGHASSYLAWSPLMIDLSLEIITKSMMEQEDPEQVKLF